MATARACRSSLNGNRPVLFVGVDSGSSGCRAIAIDANKKAVAIHSVACETPAADGARVIQDPRVWWQTLWDAVAGLSRKIPAHEVIAVALDATSASVLLTDALGLPLTPALMYNDRQAIVQAATIARVAPENSGAHGSGSSLAKALFLFEQFPQARMICHHHDWLAGRLTGRYGLTDENDALKLGYDSIAGAWPAWLEQTGLDRRSLPQVLTPGSIWGPVLPLWRDRLGWAPKAKVYAGTTDSVAATLACGVHHPGEAVTSLGSTLVLKMVSDHPVFAPRFGIYSHRFGQHWLPGGASNSGGAVLRRYFTDAQLQRLSAAIDPEKESGLDYYPLPGPGERFPVNDPNMAPRMEPVPDDPVRFLHGLLEGMARIEALGYTLLQQHGAPKLKVVYSAGGGAANAVWRRIRERLLQVPVKTAAHDDAAYGAALIAREGYLRETQGG